MSTARSLGRHAHQFCVVGVIRLDRDLDHVPVLALAILLNVHARQKLQAIQFKKALFAKSVEWLT